MSFMLLQHEAAATLQMEKARPCISIFKAQKSQHVFRKKTLTARHSPQMWCLHGGGEGVGVAPARGTSDQTSFSIIKTVAVLAVGCNTQQQWILTVSRPPQVLNSSSELDNAKLCTIPNADA